MDGVPRQQSVLHAAGAVWVDDEHPFALDEAREAGHLLRVGGVASTAVQHDDHREGRRRTRDAAWCAHNIGAAQSAMREGLQLAARGDGNGRNERGGEHVHSSHHVRRSLAERR